MSVAAGTSTTGFNQPSVDGTSSFADTSRRTGRESFSRRAMASIRSCHSREACTASSTCRRSASQPLNSRSDEAATPIPHTSTSQGRRSSTLRTACSSGGRDAAPDVAPTGAACVRGSVLVAMNGDAKAVRSRVSVLAARASRVRTACRHAVATGSTSRMPSAPHASA
ncbi:hypothetical protein COSO111634_37400 [Corallococcus soli]